MNVPEAAASVLKPRACMWFKCCGFGAACPERDFPRLGCLSVFFFFFLSLFWCWALFLKLRLFWCIFHCLCYCLLLWSCLLCVPVFVCVYVCCSSCFIWKVSCDCTCLGRVCLLVGLSSSWICLVPVLPLFLSCTCHCPWPCISYLFVP